jgi:putative addiction module killer protein
VVEIRETDEFAAWLKSLRDATGRAKILIRIQRLKGGNPGDVASVGEGVSEMRVHSGPGYRVYYVQRGQVVFLLIGGDKGSQDRDIALAKQLAGDL